jgi:hypothetical protein
MNKSHSHPIRVRKGERINQIFVTDTASQSSLSLLLLFPTLFKSSSFDPIVSDSVVYVLLC